MMPPPPPSLPTYMKDVSEVGLGEEDGLVATEVRLTSNLQ